MSHHHTAGITLKSLQPPLFFAPPPLLWISV